MMILIIWSVLLKMIQGVLKPYLVILRNVYFYFIWRVRMKCKFAFVLLTLLLHAGCNYTNIEVTNEPMPVNTVNSTSTLISTSSSIDLIEEAIPTPINKDLPTKIHSSIRMYNYLGDGETPEPASILIKKRNDLVFTDNYGEKTG